MREWGYGEVAVMEKQWEDAVWGGDVEWARHLIENGIDINSTGNNTASRAGIDAVGNVTGGGNKATQNASCNTQGCF